LWWKSHDNEKTMMNLWRRKIQSLSLDSSKNKTKTRGNWKDRSKPVQWSTWKWNNLFEEYGIHYNDFSKPLLIGDFHQRSVQLNLRFDVGRAIDVERRPNKWDMTKAWSNAWNLETCCLILEENCHLEITLR